jgi:hypothetical protein
MTVTETLEPETEDTHVIPNASVVYMAREIVSAFGEDYVYKGEDKHARCLYREAGKPSCLVGQILARLTPDFVPQEVGVWSQRQRLHQAGYTKRAIYALQIAQNIQDRRHPWNAALTALGAILEFDPAAW